ncbi:transcription factor HES-4-like [Lingula anatina]|uniref:Transcription factor HES-4-like n=1 Tax=Lingula anatina TaxID=7574 RepID=A0A1S3H6I0_LINAN|nr:transcription factor HES-4-like [Lingula anatina]|eukprot:XP_013381587.1 transcription factor HES-4-like [Lingula anatina]
MQSEKTPTRKSLKPLLEKRRRARINSCLEELKTIILDVMESDDGCKSSKLEKADILELTVSYLKRLRKNKQGDFSLIPRTPRTPQSPPTYADGYEHCAKEINAYLHHQGIKPEHRLQMLDHLANSMQPPTSPARSASPDSTGQFSRVTISASPHSPVGQGLDLSLRAGYSNVFNLTPNSAQTKRQLKITTSPIIYDDNQCLSPTLSSPSSSASSSPTQTPGRHYDFGGHFFGQRNNSNQQVSQEMWRPW